MLVSVASTPSMAIVCIDITSKALVEFSGSNIGTPSIVVVAKEVLSDKEFNVVSNVISLTICTV